MKRWSALLVAALGILLLVLWPDSYTDLRILDILRLGTGYRAKEVCTCLFVLEKSQENCDSWTRDIALNAAFSIDAAGKSVSSSYQWLGPSLPLFTSVALFQDERRGCLLKR